VEFLCQTVQLVELGIDPLALECYLDKPEGQLIAGQTISDKNTIINL